MTTTRNPWWIALGITAAIAAAAAAAEAQETDLTIAITDLSPGAAVMPLKPVIFRIDATNAGPNAAPSVGVVVTLPSSLTFESVVPDVPSWTCEHAVGVVVCSRASLAAAATESLTLVARTTANPAAELQTLATINSFATDPLIDNNIAIATTLTAPNPAGSPSIAITTPSANGTARAAERRVTVAGVAAPSGMSGSELTSVTWTNDRGGSGQAIGTTQWTAAEIVLQPGVNVITVEASATGGVIASDSIAITLTSYYLAEGSTGTFFDTDIAIINPNPTEAPGHISFLTPNGTSIERPFVAPARARLTVAVDGVSGMDSTAFSTIVTSSTGAPLVVERTMRWDGSGYGGHGAEATAPAAQWYFAEGSQGFFATYLLLFNPHDEPNRATVRYLREGAPPLVQTHDIAPTARLTIDAGADPGLVDRSFGMTVTFDRPGLAERAMYFGGPPLWRAGHGAAGVTRPSASWFFAEGSTGPFFETFILLSNPNDTPADVTVTFLPDAGGPVAIQRTLPGQERLTLNIEADAPALANAAVATQVIATQPIVAERAQYWPFTPDRWSEAHASAGVTAAALDWGLAEGRVGFDQGYETYILLANPGTTPADVTITFVREAGTPVTKTFTVAPTSRFNVSTGPNTLVPELEDERFGAIIRSTAPIMVERAMYWNANGEIWSAGTNVTATRLMP